MQGKQQHVIPQFYLRPFLSPGWQYRRGNQRPVRRNSPREVAVLAHYYDYYGQSEEAAASLDYLNSGAETDGAPALKKLLVDPVSLTDEDWSAFDFLLANAADQCFVEVKNVTLAEKDVALFPDAVTERGTKHLRHLMDVVRHGHRAVMLFLVSRGDCVHFRPAKTIDPLYAKTLLDASQNGVEILVYRTRIEPPEVHLDSRLDYFR